MGSYKEMVRQDLKEAELYSGAIKVLLSVVTNVSAIPVRRAIKQSLHVHQITFDIRTNGRDARYTGQIKGTVLSTNINY
jgi:hypothetical protein